MARKFIMVLGLALSLTACSHPVRDERNALRLQMRQHCIETHDYSNRHCHQIREKLLIDDLALAYGTAR